MKTFYQHKIYTFNLDQVHEIKNEEDFKTKTQKTRGRKSTRLKQIEKMEKIMRQTIHEKLLDDKAREEYKKAWQFTAKIIDFVAFLFAAFTLSVTFCCTIVRIYIESSLYEKF